MEVKNPFSLYDFLGYLFPGALALFILYTIYKVSMNPAGHVPYDYIDRFIFFLREDEIKIDLSKVLIPFIIVSYMFGHLFAYLSSLTIEYFTNRIFDYPSKYLLNMTDNSNPWKRYWKKDSSQYWIKYILLAIIFLILLPIGLFVFPIKMIHDFITRPFDDNLIKNINQKVKDLDQELRIKDFGDNSADQDFHRIVMHYVYLNINASRRKSDNYLALYGYLRATTLIMLLFTDWLIYIGVKSIVLYNANDLDLASLTFVLCCWMISLVSYMGFVKFYRRFTQDNMMSLLTGKWHETNA